ncbi:MAG: hypothetical protein MSG64_16225 [Pyrinomonadaceae bacterium MAG19_C2-C3]|nr:hypothetical protein [Pyrinomonadaceae bacterium MAG19_C2-C3]
MTSAVADKNHSRAIEVVRRQWSGNTQSVIRGIGIVTCIYVNPEMLQFWLLDYRIFAPAEDGKTKLDHAQEMFDLVVHNKHLRVSRGVDGYAGHASRQFMLKISRNGKIYYCPLQANRQVDEGDGTVIKYQRVDSLEWSTEEKASGKNIHVKDFPKGHRLQLFRLVVSKDRTDYVVTNDTTQHATDDTREVCAVRWKTRAVTP